ncbi:MAG: hypothetical protein DWQ34_13095 [Planctomycetota bacterium]|nr:MAG: hypothetical protein DWQ34_13095 [Planctomycetota bacterium]REJ96922.1 MAG: hypothetical protein DWQ29_00500 [Planctomycetota bacterium]REK26900.1 MAG: hypothetical protein DWQ41_08645 [Planctomycetota bacterium]REK35388.1 MAG: hypothetical protein DWQ45_11765 [Planctomycetota bacterium]
MNDLNVSDECRLLETLQSTPAIFMEIGGSGADELSLQRRLRDRYDADVVRAALTTAELRRRAAGKFSLASRMWFTRRGLEQSTGEAIARHKAERFPTGELVHDLCCGIGGDTIALAGRGPVRAVDRDCANTMRAALNAAVYNVAGSLDVVCGDVAGENLDDCLVHLDPDRRIGRERRARRVEQYQPDLTWIREMMQRARGGAVKLSPAADFASAFPDREVELVSLHGECREATVWFGALAGLAARRASVLPAGETLLALQNPAPAEISAPGDFLFDPDPAVVRAGLIDELSAKLGVRRLDASEEYLTGNEPVASPFVQTFRIESVHAFDTKGLRRVVRQSEIGELEIKARHTRVDVERLRRQLRPDGALRRTLVIARFEGKTRAIIAERLTNTGKSAALNRSGRYS